MGLEGDLDREGLEVLIGGKAVLDLTGLQIQSVEQARRFLKTYGFDPDDANTLERLWGYHKRAVLFAHREILEASDSMPDLMSEPEKLGDLTRLFILASAPGNENTEMKRWACGLLKIIHALVHLDSDLFARFSEPIQSQILAPFDAELVNDPVLGLSLGAVGKSGGVPLKKFERKAFKTPDSSLLKLLVKAENIAFRLMDKVGVRFVTRDIYDGFRVLRYLLKNSIVSLPNTIPDQSNNTLYPLNMFVEMVEETRDLEHLDNDKIDQLLKYRLVQHQARARYNEKINPYTNPRYRFIKFISRKLIKIDMAEQQTIQFFYPYEVQIVDYESYVLGQSGEASHAEYKRRQCRQARARVFGLGVPPVHG
jgi:uncharacterized protein (TIGR04562 family)